MTEDLTKEISDSEKLNLILAELQDFRAWRAKVDTFIEECARDTAPMLERIHKEIAETRVEMNERFQQVGSRLDTLEKEVKTIRRQLGVLHEDISHEKMLRAELAERMAELEGKLH